MRNRTLIVATMLVALLGAGAASAGETQPEPRDAKNSPVSSTDSKAKPDVDAPQTQGETKKERKAREKRVKQDRKMKEGSTDPQADTVELGGGGM